MHRYSIHLIGCVWSLCVPLRSLTGWRPVAVAGALIGPWPLRSSEVSLVWPTVSLVNNRTTKWVSLVRAVRWVHSAPVCFSAGSEYSLPSYRHAYFDSNLLVYLSVSHSKVDTRRALYLLITLQCALATSSFILDSNLHTFYLSSVLSLFSLCLFVSSLSPRCFIVVPAHILFLSIYR